MIDLGFVSAILGDRDFEQVVAFAAAEGYRRLEVACWPAGKAERRYAGVTHIDVDKLDEAGAAAVKRVTAEKGVAISALGFAPNPMDADAEARSRAIDHLLKVIRAASRLDVPLVSTFVGRVQDRDDDYNFDVFREVWPAIVKEAEANRVKIAIENCAMYFTRDEWPQGKNLAYCPANWRRMFEIVPSANFGLNYDPSHFCWMRMNYVKPIYEFKERIFHIHLKDIRLYQDKLDEVGVLGYPLSYHAPKLPGLGDIDWGAFFSALYDIGYRGAACVEVEDQGFEDSRENVELALRRSRDYVRQFLV